MAIDTEGYTQEDGVLPISIAERIAEMEFRGLSRSDAAIAIHGGSEPAIDPDSAKLLRIANARAQVEAVDFTN